MSKSFIFLVKPLLSNFYRHLAIFIWSHWVSYKLKWRFISTYSFSLAILSVSLSLSIFSFFSLSQMPLWFEDLFGVLKRQKYFLTMSQLLIESNYSWMEETFWDFLLKKYLGHCLFDFCFLAGNKFFKSFKRALFDVVVAAGRCRLWNIFFCVSSL